MSKFGSSAQDLKNIALDMRDEVQLHTAMVDEITSKAREKNPNRIIIIIIITRTESQPPYIFLICLSIC